MRHRLFHITALLTLFMSLLHVPFAHAADHDVSTVLKNASTRLSETKSMSFSMDVDGAAWIDGEKSMKLQKAEGIMARPDAVDVNFTVDVLGKQQVSIRMITIGDKAWITDLVTGRWIQAPKEFGFNPAVLYDDQNGLGPVMGRIENPELKGEEEVDGVKALHVSGKVKGETASHLSSNTLRGDMVGVDLWIDPSTWNIVQLKLSEPTDQDLDEPAVWTMHLSKHDEDVKIEQPK